MRAGGWVALAVVAFVLAGALLMLAFTRFDDGAAPNDPASQRDYERAQYANARWSVLFGIAGCFALLAGAACAQRAWRTRTSS